MGSPAFKVGCIILAGGKGSRLGREKAWVELEGKSLLQIAVSNVEFLDSEIIIVKAPNRELPPISSEINIRIVHDSFAGKGPLAGIFTGLTSSRFQYNFVLACDMPLLNKELVTYMSSVAKPYDAVVPRPGDHLEPLQAIYSKGCIPEIEKLLSLDEKSVLEVFKRVHTRFVELSEIKRFDLSDTSFVNINTLADLTKVTRYLKEG
jgi:Molybdopterin-guanine dinucleotide biosynthesis protein A